MIKTVWSPIRNAGNALQSPLLLLIRLYWGYQFFIAGLGKFLNFGSTIDFFTSIGIPLPLMNALLASSTELFGGLLLFFGLFSRCAAIPLTIVMLTAIFTTGFSAILELLQFNTDPLVRHNAFQFLLAALIIFCFGPGKFSLDYWLTDAHRRNEMP